MGGGGARQRLSNGTVGESAFMQATTEAFLADYNDRSRELKALWDRQSPAGDGVLPYHDFKSVLQSAEPALPAPTLRSLFLNSVEASRSCSQFEGGFSMVLGSLEPAHSNLYGGDVVTFPLLFLTAMRSRLFLQDSAVHGHHGDRPTSGQPGAPQATSGVSESTKPGMPGSSAKSRRRDAGQLRARQSRLESISTVT